MLRAATFSKPRRKILSPHRARRLSITCANAASPPSTSTRHHLINEFTHFCYQKDLPRALGAMDAMSKRGLSANCVTYSHLIKCCIALNAVQQGKLVHAHVFSIPSYNPKTFLINTLLNMYVKFNLLEDALKLFDQMPERNVVSWTTLISAFASAKLHQRALQFLILMLRQGVRPNMFTYSSVLRACEDLSVLEQIHSSIFKEGLDSDCFVRSALIDIYSRWGHSNNALSIFNEMDTRDLVVWNSVIGGFAQNSQGDEAMFLYIRMKRGGFTADQPALTSVLRACTSLALLELGRQVHVHVVKFKTDLILNNALLDMYCKCGSLKDAKSAFDGMVEMDVITWSTMIAGLAQNGYSIQALKLFEQMKVLGTCKPNYITLVGVLFACSHAGLLEDGWSYFKSMKNLHAIEPGREHYGCIIDLLGRAGKFDEAMKLMTEMECEPDAVTWRTLLGACRVHKNVELAIHAAKEILKLDPEDAGTYTLLSNIYANMQRWGDVEQVRNMMKNKGVTKVPGCSWIEVDREIHAFTLGDNSHPQMSEIHIALNELITRLMDTMGYKPDTDFVLKDVEGEQKEDSLRYHSEKIAIVYGLMRLSKEKTIRIRKNLRICGDCHVFAKLVSKLDGRKIVIRDPILYHHFSDGVCSCGDYW